MEDRSQFPATKGKTKSEGIFERFLTDNNINFEKIEVADTSRPDYLIRVDGTGVIFEVKEITKDENFGVIADPKTPHIRSFSGTIGAHVRARIESARKQIQSGAKQGLPSVLLVYNSLDYVFQDFGTSDLDFKCAMYGELTMLIDKQSRAASELFNGKNQALQEAKNTSFSAVGRLCDRGGNTTVTLYENIFAKVQVPYTLLPSCFDIRRVEVSREPLRFNSEASS